MGLCTKLVSGYRIFKSDIRIWEKFDINISNMWYVCSILLVAIENFSICHDCWFFVDFHASLSMNIYSLQVHMYTRSLMDIIQLNLS